MIEIPTIFGQVVDTLRTSGTFTAIAIDGPTGEYIFSAANHGLNADQYIDAGGIEFKVKSVTDANTFRTLPDSSGPPSFPGTFKALDPYYLFGHRLDINNRLLQKNKDSVYKYQKYPLIALRLPIPETHNPDGLTNVSLNVAILALTDQNYKSEERYENVIIPILEPLYDSLVKALRDTSYFSFNGGIPEHDKIDRLYWGIEQTEENVSNIFTDPLDAIELINLSLNVIDTNC